MEDESGRVREEIQKVQKIRETTLQMTTRAQRKKADLEKDYAALQVIWNASSRVRCTRAHSLPADDMCSNAYLPANTRRG